MLVRAMHAGADWPTAKAKLAADVDLATMDVYHAQVTALAASTVKVAGVIESGSITLKDDLHYE